MAVDKVDAFLCFSQALEAFLAHGGIRTDSSDGKFGVIIMMMLMRTLLDRFRSKEINADQRH